MPSNLHLFSNPGKNDISDIVEACRPHLEDKKEKLEEGQLITSYTAKP